MGPISDINTYWSKALQRLAFIFMGLKFLIQTVELPDPIMRMLGERVLRGIHCPTEENQKLINFIRNLDNGRCKRPQGAFSVHNSLANICAVCNYLCTGKIANPIYQLLPALQQSVLP